MNPRPERLGRLLAIRRLTEDINRRALQLALGAVVEVEAAIEGQESALTQARLAGRAARVEGDRGAWLIAEAQEEVAGWNRGRLNALLRVRAGRGTSGDEAVSGRPAGARAGEAAGRGCKAGSGGRGRSPGTGSRR